MVRDVPLRVPRVRIDCARQLARAAAHRGRAGPATDRNGFFQSSSNADWNGAPRLYAFRCFSGVYWPARFTSRHLKSRPLTYSRYFAQKDQISPFLLWLTLVFHTIHRYGELWCDTMFPESEPKLSRGAQRKEKPAERASVRATISFPSELYKTLEGIAREKKVSLAWVVREASERYVADKMATVWTEPITRREMMGATTEAKTEAKKARHGGKRR